MTNQIKEFYNKLKSDISIAKTKKTLHILEKRSIKYYRIIERSMASSEIKQDAYRDLMSIKNTIRDKLMRIR